MTIKVRPLGERVLVKRIVEEKKSQIIVINEEKTPHSRALVMEVGPDCKSVTVGDNVLVSNFHGEPIKVNEDDCLIYQEEQIIARLEQTE